jgi:ABC-type glycerol-3-phosphate transport system permease component
MKKFLYKIILLFISIIWLVPILWMINTAFKPTPQIFTIPPKWIASSYTLEHFYSLIKNWPIDRWFVNSLIIAGFSTVISLLLSIPAAYSFARLQWIGRDVIFIIFLITMLAPWQVNIVPLYFIMNSLKLLNTHIAVILPTVAMSISVFLLRQFFVTIPKDLEDAARIDGCSSFQILLRIIIPISLPAIAALAIYMFIFAWNEYTWSLVALQRTKMFTIPIGLKAIQGAYDIDYGLLMMAALLATLPVGIIFLLLRKRIMEEMSWLGSIR